MGVRSAGGISSVLATAQAVFRHRNQGLRTSSQRGLAGVLKLFRAQLASALPQFRILCVRYTEPGASGWDGSEKRCRWGPGIGAIQPETANVSSRLKTSPYHGQDRPPGKIPRTPSATELRVAGSFRNRLGRRVSSIVRIPFAYDAGGMVSVGSNPLFAASAPATGSKLCTWSANAIAWHSGELPL